MSTINLNVDGPRDPDYTVQVVDAFAESVRVLNHLTGHPNALMYASTVYRCTGSLQAGVYGLEQLCGQLKDFVAREHRAGRLGLDGGGDPGPAVRTTVAALREAARLADALGHALAAAQSGLGPVHNRETR